MQPVRYLCRILLYNCLLLSVCDQSWRLHKASEQANWRLSHSNLALAYLVTLQVATKDGLILWWPVYLWLWWAPAKGGRVFSDAWHWLPIVDKLSALMNQWQLKTRHWKRLHSKTLERFTTPVISCGIEVDYGFGPLLFQLGESGCAAQWPYRIPLDISSPTLPPPSSLSPPLPPLLP